MNGTQAEEIIERASPRVVAPLHRPSGMAGFELEGVDVFLQGKKGVKRLPPSTEVSRHSLPNQREIWILDAKR